MCFSDQLFVKECQIHAQLDVMQQEDYVSLPLHVHVGKGRGEVR